MQLLGLIDPEPHPMLHPSGPEVTWVFCNRFFCPIKKRWNTINNSIIETTGGKSTGHVGH